MTSYIPYEGTCTRDVYDGSDTVCSPGRTERRCRKISGVGEECWEETTERVCEEVERYRSESYSCTKYNQVVTYEYDYTVDAVVNVIKKPSAKNFDLSECSLEAELLANSETFQAFCKTAIVKAKVLEKVEKLKGRNKERAIKLELDFAPIEGLSALSEGFSSLSYEKEDFTVTPLSSGRSLVNVNLSKWAQFDRTKKHTITV